MIELVMIMWPVDEMGRNSVIPSTMAMMMASNMEILRVDN
jgi:hypothetical protein